MRHSKKRSSSGHRKNATRSATEKDVETKAVNSASVRDHPGYTPHFRIAESSIHTPIPVPRTFQDVLRVIKTPAPYIGKAHVHDGDARDLHDGQRKLAVAMVDALTRAHAHRLSEGKSNADFLVIYAGASIPASTAALEFFPGTKFICFDYDVRRTVPVASHALNAKKWEIEVVTGPRWSREETASSIESKSMLVFTGEGGMFDAGACTFCKEIAEKISRPVLFASDIRGGGESGNKIPKEMRIVDDMVEQARWVQLLECDAYCLKFRLPFEVSDSIADKYNTLSRDIRGSQETESIGIGGRDNISKVRYLGGTLVLQAHARELTTEMRLVGFPSDGENGRREFQVALYDPRQVEDSLAPLNSVHRRITNFGADAGGSSVQGCEKVALDESVERCTTLSFGVRGTFDGVLEASIIRDAIAVGKTDLDFQEICSGFSGLLRKVRSRGVTGGGLIGGDKSPKLFLRGSLALVGVTIVIVCISSLT